MKTKSPLSSLATKAQRDMQTDALDSKASQMSATQALFQSLLALIKWWLAIMAELQALRKRTRARRLRPWHLRVKARQRRVALNPADADSLLQRLRDLKDMEKLSEVAGRFRVPESDFFADAGQIERLMRYILAENPPWLYVSRKLSGGEAGAESHSQEVVWREQVTHTHEEVTLFIPEHNWRDIPMASLTLRPTRNLEEVWHARLLDQILPPEVLVDRHSRGEIQVAVRQGKKQRIEFRQERRLMDIEVRRPVPIPIATEGSSGRGGQLLYILLDYSASMRGKSATLALAALSAALRANMGQRDTLYLFRRYADISELWPRMVEPPLQARTVQEKDVLLDTILATNFHGGATHVNDALDVAASDIENLRRGEQLEAELLLVTDGRAEILESTRLKLLAGGIKVHTVMVTPEKNPGLESISESFTSLNISPDQIPEAVAPDLTAQAQPRRSFHI